MSLRGQRAGKRDGRAGDRTKTTRVQKLDQHRPVESPLLAGVPIGLMVGLSLVPAAIAALAGLAFLLFVAGVTALVSFTIQWLLRDRRRGDLVMLAVVVSVVDARL